jgi:hypothetical protein
MPDTPDRLSQSKITSVSEEVGSLHEAGLTGKQCNFEVVADIGLMAEHLMHDLPKVDPLIMLQSVIGIVLLLEVAHDKDVFVDFLQILAEYARQHVLRVKTTGRVALLGRVGT